VAPPIWTNHVLMSIISQSSIKQITTHRQQKALIHSTNNMNFIQNNKTALIQQQNSTVTSQLANQAPT